MPTLESKTMYNEAIERLFSTIEKDKFKTMKMLNSEWDSMG